MKELIKNEMDELFEGKSKSERNYIIASMGAFTTLFTGSMVVACVALPLSIFFMYKGGCL